MSREWSQPAARTASRSAYTRNAAGFVATLLLALKVVSVSAETTISVSTGGAWTHESDVQLQAPGGTDLVYRDVQWDTEPYKMPPYYGVRVTHWFENQPKWAIAVDFTHAKMISDLEQQVSVSGQRAGSPVNGTERLGDTFSALEFSDGHNLLTVNAVRRWHPYRENGGATLRNMYFYTGGGAGVAVPHVEVTITGSDTQEYQVAGPAAQFLGGVSVPLGQRFEFLTEYRLTYADLETNLQGGGSLSTDALTHHLNFGVGFSFAPGN
jgi:lipid A oxidase